MGFPFESNPYEHASFVMLDIGGIAEGKHRETHFVSESVDSISCR